MNEETQQQEKLIVDIQLFRELVFHRLKCIDLGEVLSPYCLEKIICRVLGFEHTGKANNYADGVKDNIQISAKTVKLDPKIYKRKKVEPRDFQSHPEFYLGPRLKNKKKNKWEAGVEIVQRRQELKGFDDKLIPPETVGYLTLEGFYDKVKKSNIRYNTDETYEVTLIHGYDRTLRRYLASLFWKRYERHDDSSIRWVRESKSVVGYTNDDPPKKLYERINGNISRGGTCFKEYKDLIKYEKFVHISVPLPEPYPFIRENIQKELELKEQANQENGA